MARQIPSLKFYSVLHETIFTFKAVDVLFMCMKLLFSFTFFCSYLSFATYILFIANILILFEIECYEVRSFILACPFIHPKMGRKKNLNPLESLWCKRFNRIVKWA